MASVSCASRESAPSDMPPVQKRSMIFSTGATSSIEIGLRSETGSIMSRSVDAGEDATEAWKSLYLS